MHPHIQNAIRLLQTYDGIPEFGCNDIKLLLLQRATAHIQVEGKLLE